MDNTNTLQHRTEKEIKDQFVKSATELVNLYIDHEDRYGTDPQLRVNPNTLYASLADGVERNDNIAYSVEAIEQAAAAEGDRDESSTDFQAAENPDYYPIRSLLKVNEQGLTVVNPDAIRRIADTYYIIPD